ncbi:MAG TPA: M14 metallopeptidase family protein, partial [Longimicrobiaceae bacterium]|nr:M14 metallopeptidase family protein [Longimicrobiaceae bacterium]
LAAAPACAPSVASIPATAAPRAAASAPSPEQVLGFQVGTDGKLAEWSQITDYFDRLAAASPRVQVERIGESVEGRPMVMAVISSPENLRRIDEIRATQARLADPRGASAEELERLIAKQPAVAFIGASLHGNEIMATQMAMELAHELVTDPKLTRELEDVVVLLVPGMNPDGLDITRDWWLRTRGTPHDGAPMPWLYHHYTGHDNNRDFFMITQPETQAVSRVLYEQWFPQVVWDVHQMGNQGARFFIPPFADPLNPNLDPLVVRMTNLVGVQMAAELTAAGKTGVSHQQTFDLWWHGGGRTVPARHNMVGILSEAASANYGDPITQNADSLRQPELGSMFPEPWAGGRWSPRDIVEYELIAGRALVGLMSRQRESFIRNWVQVAQRQIRQGGPFAYVVPAGQRDPFAAAELMRVLRRGGAEVNQAREAFTAGGTQYAAGSYVVLLAQPFRAHVKDLFESQAYPDRRRYPGGPPAPPYDLAGWSLPLQMGVEVQEIARPFTGGALAGLNSVRAPAATVAGSGAAVALDAGSVAAHRAVFEALGAGGRVSFAAAPFSAGGQQWPAGTPVVSGAADLPQRAATWARELGLRAAALDAPPAGRTLERLRVALYKPWTASMDEGWTRFVFEQWGVPFDTIANPVVQAGDLAARYDVIVVPAIGYNQIMNGYGPRAHPDYAGGIGEAGAAALKKFVEDGGTLVLLDGASEFAIRELGVPVKDVHASQTGDEASRWYAPGSLLRVEWDAASPLASGMPAEGAVFYARSPVFEVTPGAKGVRVIARYPAAAEQVLLSGYAQHAEKIAGKAALVEAQVGKGRVVMFGFRPQHRAQPYQTFKPLFNALLLGAR